MGWSYFIFLSRSRYSDGINPSFVFDEVFFIEKSLNTDPYAG
jgi:hypothetical protein